MTSRTFKVAPDGKKFRIQMRTTYGKRSKRKLKEYRRYPTENSAQNDLKRLRLHFSDGRSETTFKQDISLGWNCRNPQEASNYKASISSVRGVVGTLMLKNEDKEYWKYRKLMEASKLEVYTKTEWKRLLQDDSAVKDRLLRRLARDPKVLHASIVRGMLSTEESTLHETINYSIHYFKERLLTLKKNLFENGESLQTLRKAIYSGQTFSLLLKAKFDDEEADKDVIDLSGDDTFTFANISKAQLVRSILQCAVVEKAYTALREKMTEEKAIVESIITEVVPIRFNFVLAKQKVEEHWQRIKDFKIRNSMEFITAKVSAVTDKVVTAKTVAKWLREFKRYGLFKEDMRGCHQRRYFLEEHGLLRQFELYLKNEKSLTVDVARRNLEQLIEIKAMKDEGCKLDTQSLLPLNNRTVHRWMIKCGCKYEKATTSYYTDSHEAEETKKDFKERCVITYVSYLLSIPLTDLLSPTGTVHLKCAYHSECQCGSVSRSHPLRKSLWTIEHLLLS